METDPPLAAHTELRGVMLQVAVIFGDEHGLRNSNMSNFKHTKTERKRTSGKVVQESQWLRKRNPSMFKSIYIYIYVCLEKENFYLLEEKLGGGDSGKETYVPGVVLKSRQTVHALIRLV